MTTSGSSRATLMAQILWPAFLAAAVLEMVVFSWIDPASLQFGEWMPDHKTVYSLGFLVFWAACGLSALISHWVRDADAAATLAQVGRMARDADAVVHDTPAAMRRHAARQRNGGHRHA